MTTEQRPAQASSPTAASPTADSKDTAGKIRRVVTGHDANGKAIVMSDDVAPVVFTAEKRPGYASTEIWRTLATPAPITADMEDPTPGARRQLPTSRGSVIRINTLAPESEAVRSLSPDEAQNVFASLGNSTASTFAKNGRHPMMHRTETIDYAIVLSGEITMLLDDSEVVLKAGDVLVQCGTNHAWSNRGTVPCQIAFILLDGEFDAGLKSALDEFDGA
ncbi:cupin domain-containing protein [Pigmentiphaga litoralis]|uniref:Mannose-6-phosphate isomerase-like protein (Cupin superfamily) n=1 Tax=Pigmentiphaga litoralis TaxID=516702 RepID=A0A7Y9LNP5_9BURK|nr:cupin domain-containing protein [Pigmentiphaga litoralis]NYE23390.1 mannose-6-phosphate isomerase-like protein (cupin superfamily) [Pigmentiphaga litoralis]NYE82996.1 mannose-6-phosphate isomerase-like protein (cupin superfamily) [Pigmentiphaga litoralis]